MILSRSHFYISYFLGKHQKQTTLPVFRFNENYNQLTVIDLVFLINLETEKQAQLSIFQKCHDTFETLFINTLGQK